MSLVLSSEQQDFRDTLRRFFADKCDEAAVREAMETEGGFVSSTWKTFAMELGLCGLAVPEEYGGAGGTLVDVGVLFSELGRSLACLPYLSTFLAQRVLLACDGGAVVGDWLPRLSSGEATGTVALSEPSGLWSEDGVEALAHQDAAGWRVRGTKSYVLDGNTADLLLVAAKTESGISLFAVDATDPNVERTPLETLDLTRKQARIDLNDVGAQLIGKPGDGWSVVSSVLDQAAVAIAAEAVGGAEKTLEMAVEYAKVRVQFGRPIGSFQAIKHKCADMLVEVESAKSAAYHAMNTSIEAPTELPVAASLAKAYCCDAFFRCAAENIQVHGGIGFTWEHAAHLYFRRAKSNQLLFGDSRYHRQLLAERIGI